MARAASTDIAHEQVTDHLIRKRLPPKPTAGSGTRTLEAVGGGAAGDRDFGLAYAQLAAGGNREDKSERCCCSAAKRKRHMEQPATPNCTLSWDSWSR